MQSASQAEWVAVARRNRAHLQADHPERLVADVAAKTTKEAAEQDFEKFSEPIVVVDQRPGRNNLRPQAATDAPRTESTSLPVVATP